jgi:hypothetical protein
MPATPKRRALGGILVRRECWTLSRPAKFLILAGCVAALAGAVRFLYPFLAITDHVQGEFLVVEGWLPSYALREVASLDHGGYRKVLTSGGLITSEWARPGETYADWATARLKRMGVNGDLIQSVPARATERDRTYTAALAIRQWLHDNATGVKSVDVLTMGPHARRTRLLYQMALGNKIKVGVIAVPDKDFDPAHWWRSSEGVRAVIGEGIAYLYARCFFHFVSSDSSPSN